MENEVAVRQVNGPNAVATLDIFSTVPRTFEGIMAYCQMIADSDFVPKDYKGKAGNVAVAIQMGSELGITSMQAIQNIAVVNGRPSLWGDLLKAIVVASPLCELFDEDSQDVALAKGCGRCKVQRRGDPEPYEVTFSVEHAKTARLWGKEGSWTTNPGRMLQMRARAFACRDKFPDLLKGLHMAEEMIDVTPTSSESGPIIDPPTATRKETLAKAQERLKEQEAAKSEAKTAPAGQAATPNTGQAVGESKPAEPKKPEPATKTSGTGAFQQKADLGEQEETKPAERTPAESTPVDEGAVKNPDNWPFVEGDVARDVVAMRIQAAITASAASGYFNSAVNFYTFDPPTKKGLLDLMTATVKRLTSNKR